MVQVVVAVTIISLFGTALLSIFASVDRLCLKAAERRLVDELRQLREISLSSGHISYGIAFDVGQDNRYRRIKKDGESITTLAEMPLPVRVHLIPCGSSGWTTFYGDRVYFNSSGRASGAGSILLHAGRRKARITVLIDTGLISSRPEK